MSKFKLLAALIIASLMPFTAVQANQSECVVLLHGIHSHSLTMVPLQVSLKRAGYHTVNHHYKSTRYPLDQLSTTLDKVVAKCGAHKVNFVTHSMGGILLRTWLQQRRPINFGRVVMLAPPNRGSELSDMMGDWLPYKMALGPAGQELGTKDKSTPLKLGAANFDLGIIAGNRSLFPRFSRTLPGADDGIVSVYSTKLAGMDDHLILPVPHVLMLANKQVIHQTKAYLRTGRFLR